MNRIDATTTSPTSTPAIKTDARLRPAGLAVAIGSVLGLAFPSGLAVAASTITVHPDADKKTDTTVVTAGNVTTVTTNAIKRGVAFNSFADFKVANGDTVNLILPTDAASSQVNNLVNLVWNSQIFIDGTVNSRLQSTGNIGGRVFFVDPMGMLVGSNGVLNVGSLSVATPTAGVMSDILDGGGALNRLMAGTLKPEQLSRDGVVDVEGRINASNGVRVQARAIDVTGTILVEVPSGQTLDSAFNLQRDDVAVNTGGDDTKIELVDAGNGKLQLRAAAISDTGFGVRSADASVTIGCDDAATCGPSLLQADDIELTAVAIVDPDYDRTGVILDDLEADLYNSVTNTDNLVGLGDALVALGVDKVLGEQISVLHATTTAKVEVKNSATLTAADSIALHASTRQTIDNSAAGEAHELNDPALDPQGNPIKDPVTGQPKQKRQLFSLGAAYGQVNATTEAIIRAGATVNAGGDLSVKADAETAVKIAAESIAVNNTTTAFTAAISNVNVSTRAVIEGTADNNAINAGAVNVSAVNQASLETSATARADKSGAVGLAGAISLQDIAAEARLDRDVTTSKAGGSSGDVVVQAASITSLNRTETLVGAPKAEPLPGEEQVKAIGGGGDGMMEMAQSLVGAGFGKALEKLTDDGSGGNDPGPTQPAKAAPFRLGGAISFVDGNHSASAGIGNGVVISSAGDIVVDSQVVDAEIGNHAISNVIAKGKDADGSAFALTGAVTIARLAHEADTLVGSNAVLSGERIGLGSDVHLPKSFEALSGAVPDFSSFDAFKGSITAAKDLITDPSDLFTTYAAARGSAEDFALGAAVSYYKARNAARTDIASGATLTTRDTSGSTWSAALDGLDHRTSETDETKRARTRSYDAALDIAANVDVTALHSAGDLALKNLKTTNVGDGGAAVGGSVAYMDYENSATAIVNDGVHINAGAGAVVVDAANKETLVSLALQSGQGGSYGINGTASALDLDSHTLAGVSNKAYLNAGSVGISADEDLFVWSVAGAVTMSDSVSVGASVAYQQMDTDTHAFIGEIPADIATGTAGGGQGEVNTGELAIKASSEGLSGAVAAAGGIVSSKDGKLDAYEKQLAQQRSQQNPGFLDALKTRALGKVTGLESMATKAGNSSDSQLTSYFNKAKDALGSGSGGGQSNQMPQPKFGVAVSGSATINRARQNTRADISKAVVKDNSGNGLKLDIAAINKTLLISISGALSVTAANSNNNSGSASIAGGVAYGDIKNDTSAVLSESQVHDAGDITIAARNESEQVNVGLSIGVNASSDQSTAAAAAVSATVAMSQNTTAASMQGSTVSGKAGAAGDVSIKAVNESKIANGGGALYAGGKAGLGAAVTYAEVKDATSASIDGGSITGVDNLSVRAADASRIVAAAASGGASKQNDNLAMAGSIIVNQIANTTTASIGGGASVDIQGDLDVFAGTAHDIDVSNAAAGCQDGTSVSSGAGVDYCGSAVGDVTVDANADTATTEDTAVVAAERDGSARSSIIAVAGMAQVGGNNAGVAFAYNTIENTHAVNIGEATISAAGSNGISLRADDNAQILAVSAGIGGSTGNFTGVGSASYNAIANNTGVFVGRELPGIGGTASLNASNIHMDASDDTFIGAFAGAATIGSKVAVGAALTINDIASNTTANANEALLVASDEVSLAARNNAKILAGAVAAGAANNVAIQGSVGWSMIGNTAEASIRDGSVDSSRLLLDADNNSRIYTLSGAVAVAGGPAAIGAAINVATIADTTRAGIDGAALQVSDSLDVSAEADATTKTLAIAGTLAGTASIAGSNATNLIDNVTEARLSGVKAQGDGVTGTVQVGADTRGASYSLAGALAVGGTAGVGVASSINDIDGRTSAIVTGAALHSAQELVIDASNSSLVRTAAVSGAGAGTAAVAGSVTTNLINSTTSAELVDSQVDNELADVTVRASDERNIDSLAGSAAVAGAVGVGAAVAYNQIGGSTTATVSGAGLDLDVRNLLVSADAAGSAGGNGNRIRTIAAGVGGGGTVGGAGSVAVNKMTGTVAARIKDGADVVAEDNVAVVATQSQRVDVFAGAVAAGATTGIGLGTVVNLVDGTTEAGIYGASTQVTALGHGDALAVDSGQRSNENTHSDNTDGGRLVDGDFATGSVQVHGLAVNAATRQQVNTIGVGAAFSTTPLFSASFAVMTAVNQIAGSTLATIQDASINQHGLNAMVDAGEQRDIGLANVAQAVDVRASHHVASASYVAGIAAGPGLASGAGAISANVFDGASAASIDGAKLNAASDVVVQSNTSHNALAIVTGLGAGLTGGAATGVVNTFNASSLAQVVGSDIVAGDLAIAADNDNAASLVGGAGALGAGAAVAGTALVNVGSAKTEARLGESGAATNVDVIGALSVNADTRSDFKGVAVSGAGAGGTGIAGMAQVQVLENDTRAVVDNAVVSAGSTTVSADEILKLTAYSGSLGVGLVGTGVGAGASVAILASNVRANVIDSALDVAGTVNVAASSDRSVDMVTAAGGMGASVGIGGAASLLLSGIGDTGDSSKELAGTFGGASDLGKGEKVHASTLEGTLGSQAAADINGNGKVDIGTLEGRGDLVQASVTGGSIDANEVLVNASTRMHSNNTAGGLGIGGVAVGGAFAMTGLYGTTEATLATNDLEANRVDVIASAGDGDGSAIGLDVYAGAAGLGGLGAAVGVARLEQGVRATVSGELAANGTGTLNVGASDDSSIDAQATGAAMGVAAVGAVVVNATRAVKVDALLAAGSTVIGFRDVSFDADSAGAVSAGAVGASGGLMGAGSAAVAQASDASQVTAAIGDGAGVLGAKTGLKVEANAAPDVSADAKGVAVAGGAAIGLSFAEATSKAKVDARLGKGVGVIDVGALTVRAAVTGGTVDSAALVGSGGVVLAGTGVSVSSKADNAVTASLGDDTVIVTSTVSNTDGSVVHTGDVNVTASNDSAQSATAKGLTIGGLAAVGVVNASAESNAATRTLVGSGVTMFADEINLAAGGTGTTTATAIAGSGGAIAGNASIGRTKVTDTTELDVGADVILSANQIVLAATRDTRYGGRADSSAAGIVGASGAVVDNQISSNVAIKVGDDVVMDSSGGINVATSNGFASTLGDSPAINGSGAGVITGSAASINTVLSGTSSIDIGAGSELTAGAQAERDRLSLVAGTTVATADKAALTTGALASVAVVESKAKADFSNNVNVGAGAKLNSNRMLNIGTVADVSVKTNALVSSNGGLAVGKSDARTDLTVTETVALADNATAYSLGNAHLTAGRDWRDGGRTSRIIGGATSQGYVRGLIAVPDSSATASVNNTATTTMAQGSELKSGSFVWVGSYADDVARDAAGSGTGYQLGFIPITQNDSRKQGTSNGAVKIDGEVVAGRYNKLDIIIGSDGKIVPSTLPSGDQIDYNAKEWDSAALLADFRSKGDYKYDKAAAKANKAWVFGNLFAGGGDVTLHGDSIQGTGSVTAKGTPTITITNNSNHNVVLAGDVSTTDWSGGAIQFTGKANTVGALRLSQAATGALGAITIRNLGQNGSAILQLGDLTSRSGAIEVFNAQGSIWATGTATGESIFVNAPNGEIGIDTSGASWWAADPSVLWKNESLSQLIGDANDAAGYLANVQWGTAAKNANKSLTDYLLYRDSDGNNNNGWGSILIYGGCMYRNNGNCTQDEMRNLYRDGMVQSKYAYKNENWLPRVATRDLVKTLTSEPGSVSSAASNQTSSEGWSAGTGIKIVAGYLDINTPLTAGKGVDWSAQVLDNGNRNVYLGFDYRTFQPIFKTLNQQIAEWNATATTPQKVDPQYLGTTSSAAGARKIELYYDPVARTFITPDNIDATGGGSIYLDGFIASSSTKGSLNVISGKGSVVIDTTGIVGTDLALNNITVGNSAPGIITIIDRQKKVKTEYVKDSGGAVKGTAWAISGPTPSSPTDLRFGTNWQDLPLQLGPAQSLSFSGNSGTYNPQTGLRARWTESAYIRRSSGNSAWEWVNSAGEVVARQQSWSTSDVGYYVDAGDSSLYRSTIGGRFGSADGGKRIRYACEKGVGQNDNCGKFNFGFPANDVVWDGKTKRTVWDYTIPLSGNISVSNSVRADNPIGINFVSNDLGQLVARASDDVLLGGVLKNRGGSTVLESRNGSILATSDNAAIISNSISLTANNGTVGVMSTANPGQASRPINAQLVSYQNADGSSQAAGVLTVRAGGDVALNVDSAAVVDIDATKGATPGDVWLRTKYDLTGLNASSASVSGRSIWLQSGGSIGSITRPLVLRAIERLRGDGGLEGGMVTAEATGNIGLRDLSGDFWINSITSTGGDVLVHAADGSIFDASQRGLVSALSEDELATLRDDLKLWGGASDISVTRYENQVNSAYAEYFQLLGMGSASAAGYQAGAAAISLFRSTAEAAKGMPLDDAGVAAYLAERYTGATSVFAAAFGADWQAEAAFNGGYNDSFRYLLGSTQGDSAALAQIKNDIKQGFSENSVWTANELLHVFNANAMKAGGGSSLNATPIITGRNLTLMSKLDLGRTDKTHEVSRLDIINGLVGDDAALAMRLATTPGDVELRDVNDNLITWDDVLAGAVVDRLLIKSTAPVVVDAKGQVDATIGRDTFLRGASSLVFSHFQSGGNARISSSGDIRAAAGTVLTVGNDLSLDALVSIMGDDSQPLAVQINGTLLLASAGQHVKLAQQQGDLRIGVISANEDVVLEVGQGSLLASGSVLAALKGLTALTGRDIQLTVRDNIQEADGTALAMQILAGGQLDGVAGGDIRLGTGFDLPIGTLTAGGELVLNATAGKLSASLLEAGAGMSVTGASGVQVGHAEAGGAAKISSPLGAVAVDTLVANSAQLNAGKTLRLGDAEIQTILKLLAVEGVSLSDGAQVRSGEAIDVEGAGFRMGTGSSMTAGKIIAVRSSGDITLGQLAVSGNAAGSALTLSAAGGIQGNGDVAVNVAGGSNVQATLDAGTGIGTVNQPLTLDVGKLVAANSNSGDISLVLPNGGSIGAIDAITGSVLLSSAGVVDFDSLNAAGDMTVSAVDIAGEAVTAGGDVVVGASGDLLLTDVDGGGDVLLSSGNNLGVTTLDVAGNAGLSSGAALAVGQGTVGGNATLVSTGSTSIDTLAAQGSLDVTSGAALTARSLASAAAMTLSSGSTLDMQQLQSGADLSADAVDTLSIADATVAGDATIEGQSDVVLGTASVGKSLVVNAGNDLSADSLVVSGNSTLTSGGNTTLTSFNGQGDLVASAAGNLQLDAGTVGGNATLTSTGSTSIDMLAAQGSLDVTSGAALTARSLVSVAAMTLSSGSTLDVQQLRSGADLSADAVDTLSIADATVAGNAKLDGQSDVVLGTASVGKSLVINADNDLSADSLVVTGNSMLTSGGNTTLTSFNGQGDLVANAAGNLQLDAGTVGGNATLTSTGSTSIDMLAAQGSLDVTSGAALTARSLVSVAAMTLSSGSTLDVQQLRSGADLSADAVDTLSIADATVAGNAKLDGQSDVVLGTASVGKSLVINADNDLSADSLVVSGNSTLTSGGNTTLTSFNGQGDLVANAAGNLQLDNGTVGGNASVSSDGAMTLGTLAVIGDATATAGTTLVVDTLDVDGNASLSSGDDFRVTTLDVAGNADLSSGAALSVGQGTIGGNATLASTGGTSIDTLAAQGSLDVTSGAALTARSLASVAAMTLSSGSMLDVQQLQSGADLSADAVDTLSIADATVAGNAKLDGQSDVVLGTASVGKSLVINAANNLSADSLAVTGNSTLTSGGNTTLTSFNGQGDLVANAAGNLQLDAGTVGGNASLGNDGAMTLGTLAVIGHATATAGTTLAVDTLDVDGDASLSSGDDLRVTTLDVAGNADLSSGAALAVGQGSVGGDASLGSDGAMTLGTLAVIGDATATAGTTLVVDMLDVDGNASLSSGNDLRVTTLDVAGNADLSSGAALAVGQGKVGGNATLTSTGNTSIDTLAAQGSLDVTSGAALTARSLASAAAMTLSSGSTLDVQQLRSGADLSADAVDTLSIADVTVAGDATIEGQSDVVLGTASVGKSLVVNAGNDLSADSLVVSGNSKLASGGNTTLTSFNGQGDLVADAAGNLQLDNGTVGGNARVSSDGAMTLGTLAVIGDATATAGTTLVVDMLDVDGNASLSSGNDLRVTTLDVAGNADLSSGAALAVGQGKVGGNATLTSTGSTSIDTLAAQGSLEVTSGAALTARSLASAAAMTLSSGSTLDVQQLQSGADLSADAVDTLSIADVTVAGDATIEGQSDVVLGTASVGKSLVVNAGNDLSADSLVVSGNSKLASGGNTTLTSFNGQGDLVADAAGNLQLDAGTVGGNATLASTGSTSIDTLAAQGSLDVTTGAALTARSLASAAAMTLSSGSTLDVQQLQSGADLSVDAVDTLSIADATVAGDATIEGQSDVVLGTASVGKSLVINADNDLSADSLVVTGNSMLTSGGNTTLRSFNGQGDLVANAAGNLQLDAGTVGGNASVSSDGAMTLGTLAVIGDATATAGATLAVDTLDVDGNASLSSGDDLRVTTLDVAGNADLSSGATLAVGQGTIGGNATLASTGSTSIDTLAAQGSLDVTSGAALAARSLASAAAMTLSSGSTLDVQQLQSGADLSVDAVDTLSIADATVAGDATIEGQSDVVLGTASVGKSLVVNAANNLSADSLIVSGNSTLASGANTALGTYKGEGDLSIAAGADVRLMAATTGRDMQLRAGGEIDVGTANIGRNGNWLAAADITAEDITAGCDFNADAGGTMAIGSLQAGCGVSLASEGSLSFDVLQATTDLQLTSRSGDVRGDHAVAGGMMRVNAGAGIEIDSATAGTDLVAASDDSQSWKDYQAGRDVQLHAGGDVAIGNGRSGSAHAIISGGSIVFDRIQAGTIANMHAQGGNLLGGNLQASSGSLVARDHLTLANGIVDTRLDLAATTIAAHIGQSGTGAGPLSTVLTGYNNGVARQIVVEVDPRDAWLIDQLSALDAQLASSAANVSIGQGHIQNGMTLRTSQMNVLMDNLSPLLRPYDVQLLQLNRNFRLSAAGTYLDTDAYVIRFADGFRVTSPNYNREHLIGGVDYRGESAVRYMGRLLQLDPAYDDQKPEVRFDKDMGSDVISSEARAVNLGAPN